jgi:predicted transcriptional regulator
VTTPAKATRWTPEVLAGLLARKEAGERAGSIAYTLGIGETAVYTLLRRARSLQSATTQAKNSESG